MSIERAGLIDDSCSTVANGGCPQSREDGPAASDLSVDGTHSGAAGQIEENHQQVGKRTQLTVEQLVHGGNCSGAYFLLLCLQSNVGEVAFYGDAKRISEEGSDIAESFTDAGDGFTEGAGKVKAFFFVLLLSLLFNLCCRFTYSSLFLRFTTDSAVKRIQRTDNGFFGKNTGKDAAAGQFSSDTPIGLKTGTIVLPI